MSKNLPEIVTVTLNQGGFFLNLTDGSESLTLPEVLNYLTGLHIPNLQTSAVSRALKEKKGGAFHIAPLPGVPAAAARKQPPAPARIRWRRPAIKGAPIKNAKSLLVVDINKIMIKAFEAAFPDAKVTLSHTRLPQDFFAALAKSLPDLILLSSSLGKLDGSLLAVKIRTSPRTSGIPVIMYSSPRPRQEIAKSFDSGITDYLVMPVDARTFRNKILNVLAQVAKTIQVPAATRAAGGKKQAAPSEEKSQEPVITIQGLIKKVKEVLAVPYIVERVLKISTDSSSGAKQLAQAVKADAATTATVLKKANTAFFGKGEQISDVQEAIVRVGLDEIRSLVLGMNVIKQFSKERKTNGFDRLDYWRHSLATGILARIFARQLKFSNPEELFLAGLLHDVGKIILDEYANPPFDDIVMKTIGNRVPLILMEKEILGFTHVETGKAIADQWRLPEIVAVAIQRHHSPEELTKETARPQHLLAARLICIANILAKTLGAGSGGDMSIQELPIDNWGQEFYRLSFGEESLASFHKDMSEIKDFLEIGGDEREAVSRSKEILPDVILIDPILSGRPIGIARTHLTAMGYAVSAFNNIDQAPSPAAEPAKTAFCCLVQKREEIFKISLKLKKKLAGHPCRIVFILPPSEKPQDDKNGNSLTAAADNQTIIYEPYDIELLQNAMETPAAAS